MNSTVNRFKKRKAILDGKTIPNKPFEHIQASVCVETTIHSVLALTFKDNSTLISTEAEILLAEIHGKLDEEKISALIEACQKECLQSVIRPFGLAKVLFEDKDGGNVTTTLNFTKGIVATDADRQKYIEWQEREKMNWQNRRKPYEKKSQPIRSLNKKPVAPNIVSGYTGKMLDKDKHAHYEHITPVKEIEKSPGRNLRMTEEERVNLATSSHNTTYAEDVINTKGAGGKSPAKDDKDLMVYFNSLTEEQRLNLGLNPELIKQEYRKSKHHIAIEDRKSWRRKDGKELCSTGASEGGKMGLQQAVGVLMEEFVRAAFFEVKDAWQNGFKGSVDDSFLDALKKRFMRVAERIQNKWKDAACAFRDGFISGFLSNIITVIINMFATMSARVVRIAREGIMSLYRALKMLVFPPEDMSLAQAADAASKLLATGLITGGGILLEASFETSLKALGALAPYVSSIAVGLTTGLCTVFAVYLLDQLDIFGVNAESRHEQVVAKLDGIISDSYERAIEAVTVFDGPALIHLT